jgi:hypothetical protein
MDQLDDLSSESLLAWLSSLNIDAKRCSESLQGWRGFVAYAYNSDAEVMSKRLMKRFKLSEPDSFVVVRQLQKLHAAASSRSILQAATPQLQALPGTSWPEFSLSMS